LRFRAGFKSSLMAALSVHLGILFIFTFTFSIPPIASRPVLVFLGSFLHAQDVSLLSENQTQNRSDLDVSHLNLDSNRGLWTSNMQKPSLVLKISSQKKAQFKPMVTEAIIRPNQKKIDQNDLGIELEPLPPVKLKINRND
jgi:hypothetical protein